MTANCFCWCGLVIAEQWNAPPAGIRPPQRNKDGSILPGGRVIAPLGEQFLAGANPMAMALSLSRKTLVAVNPGPGVPSLTVLEKGAKVWQAHQFPAMGSPDSNDTWYRLSPGVALAGDNEAFVSEGASGRVAVIDLSTGDRRHEIDLNRKGESGSSTEALVYDPQRRLLYVADVGHRRVAVADTRMRRVIASVAIEAQPRGMVLAPDGRRLYVTNGGNSVSVIDVSEPAGAKVIGDVPIGHGVADIVVTRDRVFVANVEDDTITALDARSNRVDSKIVLHIPGFEQLRGVRPSGLAFHEKTGWLLVAETGINAIGVVDTASGKLLGHIPAGRAPAHLAIDGDTVFVANLGTLSVFSLPSAGELAGYTDFVLRAGGFVPRPRRSKTLPEGIHYVVWIVAGRHSFDEVLGDVTRSGNYSVMALPGLAQLGSDGYASGEGKRLSLQHIDITPNQHAIARQFAFSDNFYADADAPEAELLARDLKAHGISDQTYGPKGSATATAEQLIAGTRELPRFLYVNLDNTEAPGQLFPYRESYAADEDNAIGRILEYLSTTKRWNEMAVFITDSGVAAPDHIDARRTVLLCAGPWLKRGYVAHTNTDFAGLRKTIREIFSLPDPDLTEATAADLSECFTDRPAVAQYKLQPVDPRLFSAKR